MLWLVNISRGGDRTISLNDVRNTIKLPFDEKLKITKNLIKEALSISKNPAVGCSFGKDSTVVLYLVRQFKPDVKVIFNNTTVEMKETLEFKEKLKEEWNLNLIETKPEMNFWQVVEKWGLPATRFYNKEKRKLIAEGKIPNDGIPRCCRILKENPTKKALKEHDIDLLFDGLTYDESYNRRFVFFTRGMLRYVKKWGVWKCSPIFHWNTADVWRFIEQEGLPINKAYEFTDRVGCITCTGYIGWEKRMANHYPALYKKICRIMGRKTLYDIIGL